MKTKVNVLYSLRSFVVFLIGIGIAYYYHPEYILPNEDTIAMYNTDEYTLPMYGTIATYLISVILWLFTCFESNLDRKRAMANFLLLILSSYLLILFVFESAYTANSGFIQLNFILRLLLMLFYKFQLFLPILSILALTKIKITKVDLKKS